MARTINRLSAAQVARLSKPGRYGDGGGLWLQVSRFNTKAWLFRFMLAGRARQMGLGSIDDFSLKEARERARKARQMVRDGFDPIEARNERKATGRAGDAPRVTFASAADRYIKAHAAGWRNPVHLSQWRNTLGTYAHPVLGDLSVSAISTSDVMSVLEPLWQTRTETASRLRGRIEAVLDWAKAQGLREGENPARWKGHLQNLLPAKDKVAKTKHLPALAYSEAPAFMAQLRGVNGVPARALEFAVLSATRSGEVLGARWDEINREAKVWTIPAARTKAGRLHRVPLTDRMVAILEALPREEGNGHLFPGARAGGTLSDAAMLDVLRTLPGGGNATVHGFRSAFRDWAAEETSFPREIAEAALGHVVGDKVEAAYRRGDALAKRATLMAAWAAFCDAGPGSKADNVVPMARTVS